MTGRVRLLVAALVLVVWTAPTAFAQNPDDPLSNDDHPTLDTLAVEAGVTAGFAESCNADPTPINSALRNLLHASLPDHARRHTIWVRFKATESSTVSLFGSKSPANCGQLTMILQKEVHRLAERPL
jgi:hypothetical protein